MGKYLVLLAIGMVWGMGAMRIYTDQKAKEAAPVSQVSEATLAKMDAFLAIRKAQDAVSKAVRLEAEEALRAAYGDH